MRTWLVILAVGLGSYALRVLPVFLAGRAETSRRLERVLAPAGTAALAALIAAGVHLRTASAGATAATVAALAAGLAVAVRGGSMAKVLLAGGAVHLLMVGALAWLA